MVPAVLFPRGIDRPPRVLDKDHPGPVGDRVVVDAAALEPGEEPRHHAHHHDQGEHEDGEPREEVKRQHPVIGRRSYTITSPVSARNARVSIPAPEWTVTV